MCWQNLRLRFNIYEHACRERWAVCPLAGLSGSHVFSTTHGSAFINHNSPNYPPNDDCDNGNDRWFQNLRNAGEETEEDRRSEATCECFVQREKSAAEMTAGGHRLNHAIMLRLTSYEWGVCARRAGNRSPSLGLQAVCVRVK